MYFMWPVRHRHADGLHISKDTWLKIRLLGYQLSYSRCSNHLCRLLAEAWSYMAIGKHARYLEYWMLAANW